MAEFERQQKCHATLNDLEQATEQLYDCSLKAESQDNERRAKAQADSARLPLECQLACKGKQEQARVTGIATSFTDDAKYPHWHRQPQCKTPGPKVSQLYATPKEMSTPGHDARLNQELGLDNVYDPLASRNASPTPGPQKPPAYNEDTTTIPPICLPTSGGSGLTSGVASPVTKCDY